MKAPKEPRHVELRIKAAISVFLFLLLAVLARTFAARSLPSCLVDDPEIASFTGRIAYSNDGLIEVFDFQTGIMTLYPLDRNMAYPDWHPIDDVIAYGWRNLSLLDTETESITSLVRGWNPSWSPDGKAIVYTYDLEPRGLYILDLSNLESRYCSAAEKLEDQ